MTRSAKSPITETGTATAAETEREASRCAILAAVARIPAGRVASYGQIAWLAGLPGRARLVGRVLGGCLEAGSAVPWHRVIRASGELALPTFSDAYREQKQRLRDEGILFERDRVSFRRYGWQAGAESPLID